MADVALISVSNYDRQAVYEGLCEGLELLGGMERFVRPGERVLVKPNLLKAASPDKAVTTHPAVLDGVLRILAEGGFDDVCYGDGPAGSFTDPEKTAEACGLKAVADARGISFGDFSGPVSVEYPQGTSCKSFELYREAARKPAIISLCKMKTHALENITGAVKNQFGLVYGKNKAPNHALHPTSTAFADMLADLDMCLAPRLYIMDGIMAMEGNGPGNGDPVMMKLLLMSSDPVALDAVFARLIYLDPANVPTCVSGSRAGLGTMDEDCIRVLCSGGPISVGEAAERFGNRDFDVKRSRPGFWSLKSLLGGRKKYSDRPQADLEKCIACGICQQSCPVEGAAVHSGAGKKAEYDYSKCIRCYCCQEMCPVGAIKRV